MPASLLSPYVYPVLLLIGSNAFMTTAWYWHLRYKEVPLWQVILISWGLAFVEYCLAVPAKPLRQHRLHAGPAQDHPGSRHAGDFRRVLGGLSAAGGDLESGDRIRAHRRWRILCLSCAAVKSLNTISAVPKPARR